MEKLTAAVVKSAHPPSLIWDADPEVKGFGLRVHVGGAKSFFINYRNRDGIERRKTIGRWPTWSVEAARKEAKAIRQLVDRGLDPVMEGRERREAATVKGPDRTLHW